MSDDDRFADPLELRNHKEIHSIFNALEERAKFKIDMSLMDEMVQAVSVAKEMRAAADQMRLPSRYKTSDDLHELAKFFREAQAKRDRVIEVKLDHMPLRRSLETFWDRSLGVIYRYDSVAKMSPAPRREATINYVLQPLKERIRDVDLIIEAASEADRHLGNVHFTLKELKAIGTIYIEGERNQKGV
jgi:hypothetical protein